jgi:hypothetical protein
MKILEKESIQQLLSIIPPHPATAILHISDSGEQFSKALSDFVQDREYEYQLNITDKDFYSQIKKLSIENNLCKVKLMNYNQRRYVTMSKMYDFVFVTASIPKEFELDFIKKIHIHMKNGANIIIFLPKNDIKSKYRWFEHLDNALFVAMNSIDIFENYEIIIAKKMHGWGN